VPRVVVDDAGDDKDVETVRAPNPYDIVGGANWLMNDSPNRGFPLHDENDSDERWFGIFPFVAGAIGVEDERSGIGDANHVVLIYESDRGGRGEYCG
jgi:hypothetical protein